MLERTVMRSELVPAACARSVRCGSVRCCVPAERSGGRSCPCAANLSPLLALARGADHHVWVCAVLRACGAFRRTLMSHACCLHRLSPMRVPSRLPSTERDCLVPWCVLVTRSLQPLPVAFHTTLPCGRCRVWAACCLKRVQDLAAGWPGCARSRQSGIPLPDDSPFFFC